MLGNLKMVIERCFRCGKEVLVNLVKDLSEYQECWSKELCGECKSKLPTAAEKLARILLGEVQK